MLSDKVTAATAAATASAAIGTIAFWLLKEYARVDVPEPVRMAVVGLLTMIGTGLAGYFTPEKHPAPSAIETVLAPYE